MYRIISKNKKTGSISESELYTSKEHAQDTAAWADKNFPECVRTVVLNEPVPA